MSITETKTILYLFAIIAPILSAPDPNGCIETCLSQRLASLRSASQNLDYSKSGNWSEHNQYNTDGGRGRVHEEHGQYVDGSNRMRYFKRNYTSSHSSGDAMGTGLMNNFGHYNSESLIPTMDIFGHRRQILDDGQQSAYVQSPVQRMQSLSTSQNAAMDELKKIMVASQQALHQRSSASSRLEDFSNSENTLDRNHLFSTKPKTGGVQEQAYEEHGQVQSGPAHIRYYKKNYTSNYSSVAPSSTTGTDSSQQIDLFGRDSQLSENSQYQSNYGHRQAGYDTEHVNKMQQQHTTQGRIPYSYKADSETSSSNQMNTYESSRTHEIPVSSTSEHLSSYDSSRTREIPVSSFNQHSSSYESSRTHETPVPSTQQSYKGLHGLSIVRDQVGSDTAALVHDNARSGSRYRNTHGEESYQVQYPQRNDYQSYENGRKTAELGSLREETVQSSNLSQDQHRGFQNIETLPSTNPALVRQYEEKHSHSSHYKESVVPRHGAAEAVQGQHLAHQQSANRYGATYQSSAGYAQHSSYYNQGRNTFVGQSETGGGQQFGAPTEKLVVDVLDLGQGLYGADCTGEEAGHFQHSQYRRRSRS